MNDHAAYEYYRDPAHRIAAGPARKHPKDRLTGILTLRISPSLLGQAASTAAAENTGVSAWVRRVLRDELARRRMEARRPGDVIPGSGRRGAPQALSSSRSRSFSCPHLSVSNVAGASCGTCGPLSAVS